MTASEAKRLKAMEDENAKLKKLIAEQMLDMAVRCKLLQKEYNACREARSCRASGGPSWVVGTAGVRDFRGGPQDGALPVAACARHDAAYAAAGSGHERPRFGYRRLFVLPRREGEASGINRIYRLNREEWLTVRKCEARRKAIGTRPPILIEARANARWSLNLVHDLFACLRRFRVLNVVNDARARVWRQSQTLRSQGAVSRGS
ncbi:MAG: hypothetical protein EAZ40_16575 [Rhodobacterales bacterium]|nr:MAG: hypothetical protein EAZ40_16575 [Rhodobacterales bacterium]